MSFIRWLVAALSLLASHHHHPRYRRPRPMQQAIASWYQDAGETASGFHAYYGFASLTLPFGTRVRFCFPAGSRRCVLAVADDRGPYVGGRTFDLNEHLAGALGFSGVQTVAYRIGG